MSDDKTTKPEEGGTGPVEDQAPEHEVLDSAMITQRRLRYHALQTLHPEFAKLLDAFMSEHQEQFREGECANIEPMIWVQWFVGTLIRAGIPREQHLSAFSLLTEGLARQLGFQYELETDGDPEPPRTH